MEVQVRSPPIADLSAAGVPNAILDELRALVAAGADEAEVVNAFLEAIVVLLKGANGDRRALRALRSLRRRRASDATNTALESTIRSRMAEWTLPVPVEAFHF